MSNQYGTYHLQYPPFSNEPIEILTDTQFWGDLPANHHYEQVKVGEGGDYPTFDALQAYVSKQNEERRATSWA